MNIDIINKVNDLLQNNKMTKKSIYETLLSQGVVKPNSEKLVLEVIEYGVQNGLINANKIIKFKKKQGKLPSIFSIDQLTKLFDVVDKPKVAMCMWLGIFCGLRIREVCNLQVSDIDFNNKIIFIRDSKNTNRTREGYGKDRNVSIPDIAINPMKRWLDIIQGGKWFIPSMQDSNRPIRTKTIHEQLRALFIKCELNDPENVTEYKGKNHGKTKVMKKTTYKFRFHSYRHFFASYLLEKSVPLENISRSLGHNQLETTLIYAKVRDIKTKQLINDAFNTPKAKPLQVGATIEKAQESNISAEEILKQRLARGEIDLLTYKRILSEFRV